MESNLKAMMGENPNKKKEPGQAKSKAKDFVDKNGNKVYYDPLMCTGPKGGRFSVKGWKKKYKKRKSFINAKGKKVFYEC